MKKPWKWWCKTCGVLVSVHCSKCEKCADAEEDSKEAEKARAECKAMLAGYTGEELARCGIV